MTPQTARGAPEPGSLPVPAAPPVPDSGRDGTGLPPVARLLLAAAVLPSLILVFVPIVEADVAALLFSPTRPNLAFWASHGRPLLHFVMEPAIAAGRAMRFPAAACAFGVSYAVLLAVFLVLLARVLAPVLRSATAAAYTAAFIALHFHFYEVRMWGGSNMLLAADVVMAALAWLHHRGTKRTLRPNVLVAVTCVAVLAALNLHQAGAFLALPLILLGAASALLNGRAPTVRAYRLELCLLAGFAAACALYAVEMAAVTATAGLVPRQPGAGLAGNALHFVRKFPLWAPAVLPLPQLVRDLLPAFGVLFALACVAAGRCAGAVSRRRRVAAVMLVAGGVVGGVLPSLATEGVLSSRVLIPSLVALWGGFALFISPWLRSPGAARSQYAWAVLFVAAWVAHLWGFGLAVAIKHDAGDLTRQMRADLVEAGIRTGEKVAFHETAPITRAVAWSGCESSVFASSWGTEILFRNDAFVDGTMPPLPDELPVQYVTGQPLPRFFADYDPPARVGRRPSGVFALNGGAAAARQFDTDDLFHRPWRRQVRLPLGALASFGVQQDPGGFAFAGFRGRDDDFRLAAGAGSTSNTVWFTAVPLTRGSRVEFAASNASRTTATVEVGTRGRGGALHLVQALEVAGGCSLPAYRVEVPAANEFLWVRVIGAVNFRRAFLWQDR